MISHKELSEGFHDINIGYLLDKMSHRDNVRFALFCAEDVFHLVGKSNLEMARKYIEQIKDWLNGLPVVENADFTSYIDVNVSAFYCAVSAFSSITIKHEAYWCAIYAENAINKV